MAVDFSKVYAATYSNVPVYEFSSGSMHVMRRRSDNWINATHILKVAEFDKPARTRILEREVQKGIHEKVQGGYGKYQGTWVPLHDGRLLAERNNVLEKLRPIFDFVPGDRSPPPAPKHATAVSNKPKVARQNAAARRAPVASRPHPHQDHYDYAGARYNDDAETPDNVTIASESHMSENDGPYPLMHNAPSRKRKRTEPSRTHPDSLSLRDQQHEQWADHLLDYFMLLDSEDPLSSPPEPPLGVNLDRAIDDKGHTALHWAASMGDIPLVRDLIRRGASVDSLSKNGETPLMRAVMFTNNYDKNSMGRLAAMLQSTVSHTEWFGSTVFHHIAALTCSKSKHACARYYLDAILDKLAETRTREEISQLLDVQDRNGDTALMIAARYGARKCVRSLLGRNASVDIANGVSETGGDLIQQLNSREAGRYRQASSSPFQMPIDDRLLNGEADVVPHYQAANSGLGHRHSSSQSQHHAPHYRSDAAVNVSQHIAPLILEKGEKLAMAFEAELEDKDKEIEEAERLVKNRKAEIDSLKRQRAALAADDVPEEVDERERAELAALMAEMEGLVELQQQADLAQLVNEEENREVSMDDLDHVHDGNDATEEAALRNKLGLAVELAQLQEERRALVKEHVFAQSMAGMAGGKGDEYKRLISAALGLSGPAQERDIGTLMEEVLKELEDTQEG